MALLFATPVVLHRERVANPPQSTSIDSPWTFPKLHFSTQISDADQRSKLPKSSSSPRDGTGIQRRAVWIKTPSRRGSKGWFQKIKSYLQKWDVGQHLGNLLSIVAFIQEIQLQWNVLLSFFHQPRKRKVWEEPMNHLHQHLAVTRKTCINSKCVCRCTTMMHTTYFLSKNLQEWIYQTVFRCSGGSTIQHHFNILKGIQLDSKHIAHTSTVTTTTFEVFILSCFQASSVHSPPSPLYLWCSGAEL